MELLKVANGNIPRTEEEKQKMIDEGEEAYARFLTAMGFDYKADENSKDTPRRYAKSFVEDLIKGSLSKEPVMNAFPNAEKYSGMVCQAGIPIHSLCSHHHREVVGLAHVAYIPGEGGLMIGLSKLNRIAHFYAQRAQIQESLTKQIHDHVNKVCKGNLGIAVLVQATHGCVTCRGVKNNSQMFTCELTGVFIDQHNKSRDEFYRMIELSKK